MIITIGIIDRDKESREKLMAMLDDSNPDPLVGEKPDLLLSFARESFDPASIHPDECHPSIILINTEGQPADSIRRIKTHFPETQVIVVSDTIDTAVALKAYRDGAVNYVQKSTAEHFLYYAIMSTISSTRGNSGRKPHRIKNPQR